MQTPTLSPDNLERHPRAGAPARRPAEPASAPDFSIIIVSYNVREFLRQALLSVRRALAGLSAEIFVVDNASDDGSAAMVRAQFPECVLLENARNLGFAAANNLALAQSRGRFVVLLNPDTVVQEDTFSAIRDFLLAHPATGLVGCKVLNPDGSLQLACRRSFPTPWVAFTKLSGLSALFPRSRWFGRYNLTYLPEDETCEVEAISGSFMVARREAMAQVGLLDEAFFMYGEDLDWCFRFRAAGWQIHYFPGTQIVHFKGESSKRSSLDSLRAFYQAMGLFVRKHFRRRMFIITYWLLHAAIWVRALMAFAKSAFDRLALPLLDLFILQLNLGLAIWLRFERSSVLTHYLVVDLVYSFVWLTCLALFGCYQRARFSSYQALVATLTGFLINASLTYFFKQYAFSRQVVLLAGVLNLILLAGWRLLVKVLYHLGIGTFSGTVGRTLLGTRTLIVGDFPSDVPLVERLKLNFGGSYELVGLVSLEPAQIGQTFAGLPVIAALPGLDTLLQAGNVPRIQQIIFSTQRVPFDRIMRAMSRSRRHQVSFKLVPSHLDVIIGKSGIDDIAQVPLIEIENRLARTLPRLSKRGFDLGLAALALVLLAPFFLIRLLLVRRCETVEIAMPPQPPLRLWHLAGGSRIDRWPWLLAILRGRLTWVGRELWEDAADFERVRGLGLLPGLTGLAQVSKRKIPLSQEEKDKYYLYYVTHYSPLLDLEILFRAFFRI
ncbi:MAG: glycosyltransferase [candidate division KSB1 bacterium]|nr:glycosyltransferase [candidate division KSB1 bacterium]MDZ7274676.1 glycosyltransferase [candidate division KSB1 bacterium]MDZ7285501.1 glycosyltransferase [candidate division KSB1 bacterium]MDZ7298533.1 glycosyltransferase [candidate division KSB1 bacterium]MDZ7306615.1 glycosyltransferase [candidate division KSB1 bacterium]